MDERPVRPRPATFPGAHSPFSANVTIQELAAAAGLSVTTVTRLIRLGALEPVAPGTEDFPAESVRRLRRMLRLRTSLRVDWFGLAIIEDLLCRIDELEAELRRLRGGGP